LPRSRGADDAMVEAAMAELDARGFVTDHRINDTAVRHRQAMEDRLDLMCVMPWQLLGDERTNVFIELVAPVGDRLLERVNETAGPNWMPAARLRRAAAATPVTP